MLVPKPEQQTFLFSDAQQATPHAAEVVLPPGVPESAREAYLRGIRSAEAVVSLAGTGVAEAPSTDVRKPFVGKVVPTSEYGFTRAKADAARDEAMDTLEGLRIARLDAAAAPSDAPEVPFHASDSARLAAHAQARRAIDRGVTPYSGRRTTN